METQKEMTIASLGHDDIQFWLLEKNNRDTILNQFIPKFGRNLPVSLYQSKIEIEKRIKQNYEPEIFIDGWETREEPKRLFWRWYTWYREKGSMNQFEVYERNYCSSPSDHYEYIKSYASPKLTSREQNFTILWEIKPVLQPLGEVLRQLQKYKQILHSTYTILVYNSSKINPSTISTYFGHEGIWVFQLLPNLCERLESF